jgi:hypothetical protein
MTLWNYTLKQSVHVQWEKWEKYFSIHFRLSFKQEKQSINWILADSEEYGPLADHCEHGFEH